MTRLLNSVVFLCIALAVHIAAAALRLPDLGGSESAGNGGEAVLSLEASTAGVAAMVEAWETPPEALAEPDAPEAMPEPDVAPDLPAPVVAEALPEIAAPSPLMATPPKPRDAFKAPEPPKTPKPPKPKKQLESKAEPEPKAQAKAAPAQTAKKKAVAGGQTSSKQSRAAGSGGGAQAGNGQKAKAATLSKAKRQSLLSSWGASIRTRVERRKRAPRGVGGGTVVLSITVAKSGALAGVGVAQSSGVSALDQAAVQAVKRAGRFPAAPNGLTDAQYTFRLPIRFTG